MILAETPIDPQVIIVFVLMVLVALAGPMAIFYTFTVLIS